MKSTRISLIVFMLLAFLLLAAGCDRHYEDVYINDECLLVEKDNETVINPLELSVGDEVIFNNMNDYEVQLIFPPDIFDKDFLKISGGEKATVKAIKALPEGGDLPISCRDLKGAPKVVVDEDP